MEKKELITKLRIIGSATRTIRECEEVLSITEEDYLKAYAPKPLMPSKKELIDNKCPDDAKVNRLTKIVNILFIACLATLIYTIADFIVSRIIGNIEILSKIFSLVYGVHLISLVVLPFAYIALLKKRSLFKVDLLEYNYNEKLNNDIREYNKSVYPLELEKYDNDLKDYEQKTKEVKMEYKLMIDTAKSDIEKTNSLIDGFRDIVSSKYAPISEDLAELIEDGRADDVKEAINVYLADRNSKLLLQEQQRKNDILADDLSRQRQEQERYNNEMLVLQSQQARELEKQTEQMKMQREEMLRQQKQMNQVERNRQSSLKNASDRYKSASQRYSTAVKTGNKFYAADAKRDMDEAYADMLKNQ